MTPKQSQSSTTPSPSACWARGTQELPGCDFPDVESEVRSNIAAVIVKIGVVEVVAVILIVVVPLVTVNPPSTYTQKRDTQTRKTKEQEKQQTRSPKR